MRFIGTLLDGLPYVNMPSAWGWLVLVIWVSGILALRRNWQKMQPPWNQRSWLGLVLLLMLVILGNGFIGLEILGERALPLPGIPLDESAARLMLFGAVFWFLAAGVLGPWGGLVTAGLAGVLRAVFDTHNPFTPLEMATLGLLTATLIRQRYRTPGYRLARQPLVAAFLLLPLHLLFYLVITLALNLGSLPSRLDYALSHLYAQTLAFGGEVLLAGLVNQVLAWAFPRHWGRDLPLEPSPAETRLETRFLLWVGGLVLLFFLALLTAVWSVAGRSAREMFRDRLAGLASSTAQTIPFFLETGQNLVLQMITDPIIVQAQGGEATSRLAEQMQSTPYFDQLVLLSGDGGQLVAAYPPGTEKRFFLYPEEQVALRFAAKGVLMQIYTLPPEENGIAGRVSFIGGVVDAQGKVVRVLVARTSLERNPLTQPLLESLRNMSSVQGIGVLVDENNRILYHPDPARLMQSYSGTRSTDTAFYDQMAPDGTRQLVFEQPVPGRAWSVILTIPAQQAQQLALNIATPLALTLFLLTAIALVTLRLGLGVMTASLHTLAREANRIAQGQLDHPLAVSGYDEIGQLSRSFEQMRRSLRARLDELNRLLRVSQGVASSLEMRDALYPVLEAVLDSGASAVRVVLSPSVLPETPIELPTRFALGKDAERFAALDETILALAQRQERVLLPDLSRGHPFQDPSLRELPSALLAIALKHEQRYYGVLWAAYDSPRLFSEADVRFITTLGGQAALAAANAHLFLTVEAGRRQLEAILNSSPDPILVTDPQNRLFLVNPAAQQVLNLSAPNGTRPPVGEVIQQPVLLQLLSSTASETQSAELMLHDERTYLAIASPVVAEGRPVGRVCILRDVTHFKQLDMLKSEFVATVSHDLRSPLTLMRGYATMLEMVGDLNEQQQGYVRKIIMGVENMSRLVNNLLDLGRIELGVGLQVEPVAIRDTVEHVVSTLQLQATQKRIDLSLEVDASVPPFVEADQALIHQALYNLVENALKYTPEEGRVTVRVRPQQGETVLFEVADTGIGIAPADLPRLFEKFYRARQREARAQYGSGLGLAIVRSIAERHGGKVWVESELGKGSTFFLQVPLKQSPKSQK